MLNRKYKSKNDQKVYDGYVKLGVSKEMHPSTCNSGATARNAFTSGYKTGLNKDYKDAYTKIARSNFWTRPVYWAGYDLAQYEQQKGLV